MYFPIGNKIRESKVYIVILYVSHEHALKERRTENLKGLHSFLSFYAKFSNLRLLEEKLASNYLKSVPNVV